MKLGNAYGAYRVALKTTTDLADSFVFRPDPEEQLQKYPCVDGHVIVVTDDPTKIYETFGKNLVTSITTIEPGYIL